MLRNDECIVSVGSDIKLQWTQTSDGIIDLSIRLITERGRLHHIESYKDGNRILRFQLALDNHYEITKPTNEAAKGDHGQGSQDSGSEDGQSENDGDEIHLASRYNENNSAALGVCCKVCQNIRGKIEKEFGKHQNRIQESHCLWAEKPQEFFGSTSFTSSEQWSFRTLTDTKNLNKERTPFHKVNLTYHLQKRLEEAKSSKIKCRKTILQEIYPGFEKMTRKEKTPLYRRFERYIEEGQALIAITARNKGILLIIASYLSRKE